MKCVKILINGIVQGVFFRAFTQNEARKLGIAGYVRNTEGGKVEVVANGDEEHIEKFIEILRKGPIGARISNIEISWITPVHNFKDFKILR